MEKKRARFGVLLEIKRGLAVIMDVVKDKKVEMSTGIDGDLSRKVTKGALWVTLSSICGKGLGV